MRRPIAATLIGIALVLVGGYFLAHDAFGFVLPQIALAVPPVNFDAVAAEIAGSLALVRWNLAWPLALMVAGVVLLSSGWRTRAR